MSLKHRHLAVALLLLALVPEVCPAQASKPAATGTPAPAHAAPAEPLPGAPASSTSSAPGTSTNPDCTGGACDLQPSHITSVNPPPAPAAPWSLPERFRWMAEMLLMVIAAVACYFGVSLVHKIERQTRYAEEAAQAATEAAKAALLLAENQAKADRPWLLVTAEPMPGSNNNFSIIATNRGRSPARVVSLVDCIAIVQDESELPIEPIFKTDPRAPLAPMLLLPGESANIKSFSRDEVKSICENPEEVLRIEEWEEKIFLYGVVVYSTLSAPSRESFESGWCCWYIHGRQKSGMIMAGPPEYNKHT